MVNLETIRDALLAPDPYTRMDALVRAEMAAGRRVKEIFDIINPLIDDALATPGLTEDGEEAFLGTLDALTGNCHRDCQYKDPPNTSLPSEEEIATLPRWARVAFAARCARRVLPLLAHLNPRAKPESDKPQRVRIEQAERASSSGEALRPDTWYADAVWPENPIDQAAHEVRNASVFAVLEATGTGAPPRAFLAARSATVGADLVANITPVIRRDFDHLASLARWQHWTDDTPVPPEVFGPLWPEGAPKGWPPVTDAPPRTELALELFPRDRATDRMIEDDVVHLFNTLNRYHIARGGVRLTLEQFRSLIPALVPAEA